MASGYRQYCNVIFAATPSPPPTPSPSPTSAGGPAITDWLTGLGTSALAFATVMTLIVTVWITTTDRRRAEERQRREVDLQRQEKKNDAIRELIGRIAELIPYIHIISAVFVDDRGPETEKARQAVRALEHGVHTQVSAIGDDRAADQYRNLAYWSSWVASRDISRLVAHTDQLNGADGYVAYTERVPIDLISYALFVRMSLENLIEKGQSLDPGEPACPDLTPDLVGPRRPWEPENYPQKWRKDIPWDVLKSVLPYAYLMENSHTLKARRQEST